MTRPRLAFYWCSGCGGCDEALIDLGGDLLEIARIADIVLWPVAMDFKYSDVKALDDGSITAALINGAVRMDEQVTMARLLRRKARCVVALGSCAHLGGVVGLGNFHDGSEIVNRAFREVPSLRNPEGTVPSPSTAVDGSVCTLSGFHRSVRRLCDVIDVDFTVPGCPPPPALIKEALFAVLEDDLPPRGSILGEKKALCDTCPRRETRPAATAVKSFKRVHCTETDGKTCFLDRGIVCLGPATRGGCGALCVNGGMPCRGCFGPPGDMEDMGLGAVAFLASMVDAGDEREIGAAVDSIPDPAGLYYKYSLAASALKGRSKE
jgi:F420-non-reducing hydrogenase small subunit